MVYFISFSHLHGRCASKLNAFGKVTCKGKVACGIASHGLSNNQKDLGGGVFFGAEGQVLLSLADHHMVPSLYCCSAWDKWAGTEGIRGKGILTRTF